MKKTLISLALILASFSLVAEAPAAVTQTKKSTAKKTTSKKAPAKKQTKKRSTRKSTKKTPIKTVTPKVDPTAVPVAGTWYTVDSTGKFVKMNKFVLDKYGKFKYVGPGWTSEGTFKLVEQEIRLVWTKIDGAAVKPNTVKKTIPVTPDRKFFQLDRFKYGKAS